ncbi:hypothetical protein ACFVT5_32100 [Streptomyces sp. NPDC058001]|uniref:hypothetical protein n=1 Tax=Streptomyces sp. NPDC058001 TaxID=3346300 RepID=UPI0036EBA276
MRTYRALAVSAAAVAAVGLAAPTAAAGGATDLNNIVATPNVVPQGGQLAVTVEGGGCDNGTVESPAFQRTRLSGTGRLGNNIATATVTIDRDARAGSHEITADCNGRRLTRPNAFTVVGGVRGGIGGSTETGATRTDMAIGGGLVAAAALGGGVFWMRRRADNRV